MEETKYFFFLFHIGWFVNSFITCPVVVDTRQLVSDSATPELKVWNNEGWWKVMYIHWASRVNAFWGVGCTVYFLAAWSRNGSVLILTSQDKCCFPCIWTRPSSYYSLNSWPWLGMKSEALFSAVMPRDTREWRGNISTNWSSFPQIKMCFLCCLLCSDKRYCAVILTPGLNI